MARHHFVMQQSSHTTSIIGRVFVVKMANKRLNNGVKHGMMEPLEAH